VKFLEPLLRFFRREMPLPFPGKFDPEACIAMLLDKAEDEANRDAAAESLPYTEDAAIRPRAVDALFTVACDKTDSLMLREAAAEALGAIWSHIGVDRVRFYQVPDDVRFEVWASIPRTEATSDLVRPPSPYDGRKA
jgi:hypothetical protein